MIAIVRISGQVKVREEVLETFRRLGLSRKYSCIVLENPNPVELGMLREVKDFVAFGELDSETFKELVAKRGKKFKKDNGKRQVFRLHPPRGGINTKQHYDIEKGNVKKGVLGNHGDKINVLVRKML
jgi:large subunit ribosomal protein L30